MGCKSSKTQKQIIRDNGDIFNKDGDVRKKLLTGFQMSKDTDGIEANFQIAFWKRTRKKYEKLKLQAHLLSRNSQSLKRRRKTVEKFSKDIRLSKFFFSLVSLLDKLLREVLHIIFKMFPRNTFLVTFFHEALHIVFRLRSRTKFLVEFFREIVHVVLR